MTVSGFTLMSRVLGFIRDILIARFVGTAVVADAFFAAFRFPNMFRRIFGEGAFNSAFVPLFGKRLVQEGQSSAFRFANNAFSFLFLILGILTVALIPLMAFVMLAVVPGFLAKFDQPLTAESAEFRIALRGAKAVYFEAEEPGNFSFSELLFIERGTPKVGKVLAEVVGGETQAVGTEIRVVGEGANAFEDDQVYADWSPVIEPYQEGSLLMGSNRVMMKLPDGHDFAVIEGAVSGAGNFKIYRNDPEAYTLTVRLAQITFVYLLCMALVAHLSGVLTTLKKFAAPAFSPVLLNIVFLVGLLGVVRFTDAKGEVLAWCVAVAGFVQLFTLWGVCRRAGLPVALTVPKFDLEIKRLLLLMGPGVIAAGIQQINLVIGGMIASFQQGAISFLYYSDRVYQLPLGVIGIAFGMVLLPEITRLLKSDQEAKASQTMVSALELAMIITVPAAIALMVIPREIMSLLFERGDFTASDSAETGKALAAFAIGLPGYVLIKILQPGFFARENTKSPMWMAGITVLVNIVISLALFPFFGHVGIAFATSVSAWVNVLLLWLGLKGFVTLKAENWKRLIGMVIASAVMAVGLNVLRLVLAPWLGEIFWQKMIAMIMLIGAGAAIYGAAVLVLKVTSVRELKSAFRG